MSYGKMIQSFSYLEMARYIPQLTIVHHLMKIRCYTPNNVKRKDSIEMVLYVGYSQNNEDTRIHSYSQLFREQVIWFDDKM